MGWWIFWIVLVFVFGSILGGDHRQADVTSDDRPAWCEDATPEQLAALDAEDDPVCLSPRHNRNVR